MTKQQLYKKFAKYYDKIYADKDYKSEAEFIKWLVKTHKRNKGNKLLDVACGTGNHISFLHDDFTITGVDVNPEMLKIAKKKVKSAKFIKGDMTKLELGDTFDVIICMFATIAYNLTYDELEDTIKIFYRHLQPGGVVVFDLHIHEDYFLGGQVWVNTVVEKDLQLARISPSPEKKEVLDLNLIFLIKEKGKVDFEIDQHQIGLFNTAGIKKIMNKVGFITKIYAGFNKKLWNKKMKSPVVFVGIK
ncbi:MAG: class I SAM-dependent methyltransferase [Thermoplasmata archaeon]|nr:class I SAM-dependent methyltransferase [Thermoplasmata archaeon]